MENSKYYLDTITGIDTRKVLSEKGKTNKYIFKNVVKLLEILERHVKNNSKIIIHTDVDFDGLASTFELDRALRHLGCKNINYCGNTDKVHGVKVKNAIEVMERYYKPDLIIVGDSSSNELEYIKTAKCDIVVIDHHNMKEEECISGKCNDGIHEFSIVNNNIRNYNVDTDKMLLEEKYMVNLEIERDDASVCDMSCGVVIHEMLELYFYCIGKYDELMNMMIYQWAGMSLYTDSINTLNKRNQWYINNTVHKNIVEPSMHSMIQSISKYNHNLSKSLIEYKIAPIINKAIRADKIAEVIEKTVIHPELFYELQKYEEIQKEMLKKAEEIEVDTKCGYIAMDVGKHGIKRNYNGVIAANRSGLYGMSAVVYQTQDRIASGSFRGVSNHIDYLSIFKRAGIHAEGHEAAFGYEAEEKNILKVMGEIGSIDRASMDEIDISIGQCPSVIACKCKYKDMNEFREDGKLMMLALYNSNVSSKYNITINVNAEDVTLQEYNEKYLIYNLFDTRCVAYEELHGGAYDLYIECGDTVNFYLRNKKR